MELLFERIGTLMDVMQIAQKQHTAVVADRIDPAGERDCLTDVFFAQITAGENVSPMNIFLLLQKMEMVTDKELESAAAKALYDKIMDRFPDVMNASISGQTLFDEGKKFYDAEDYKTANEYFAMAYEQSPDNQEILYLLGRTYQLLDDNPKALTYYREYADNFPDGEYLNTVNQWIDAISG